MKPSPYEEKVAALRGAVQWVIRNPSAEHLFGFAVVSRSVMAQGSGLTFNEVKDIIDSEFTVNADPRIYRVVDTKPE